MKLINPQDLGYVLEDEDLHLQGELDIPNKRYNNLAGYRFGHLLAVSYKGVNKNNRALWHCKCDCGREVDILGNSLLSSKTTTCGHSCIYNSIVKDISNNRYGKLVALSRSRKGLHSYYWLCRCDCGNTIEVSINDLSSGNVKSCGCLKSWKEKEIEKYLLEHNIEYKKQYHFEDLRDKAVLRFDFAIFTNGNLSFLIEYQGEQHYNEQDNWHRDDIELHDKMKKQYCTEHNILLLYLDKNNFDRLDELVKKYLKNT